MTSPGTTLWGTAVPQFAGGYSALGTPITLGSMAVDGDLGNGAVFVTPATYAWSLTYNGSPLPNTSASSSFDFTPAQDGTYVVTLSITDSSGNNASTAATYTVTDPTDPLYRPVLNQSDFTYLGSFTVPTYANGWDTAFSNGGIALRYDNGRLDFLTTNHVYSGGQVYEVSYPGISTTAPYPVAPVVYNWGDIYSGQKEFGGDASLGNGTQVYGLYYDQTMGRLYWNYGYWYNDSYPFNPSFGYSTLNDATGVATGMGAWSLANRYEKFDRGGTTPIPQWFANRFTGGDTLAVGFGGYFSIVSTGSFGPALAAVSTPNLSTNPDDSALPNVPLLGYPAGAPARGERDPNITPYFEGIDVNVTNPLGAPDQPYPASWGPSGGVGYWSWNDLIYGAGTWIDLPGGKQGVMFIAKVGQGVNYYNDSTTNSQTGAFEWMVYNPADLAAVASGLKQQWQIQPEYEWTSSTLPLPSEDASGWQGTGLSQVGGITFDPTTNRLYVLVNGVLYHDYEYFPEIYVYQVGTPITVISQISGGNGVQTAFVLTVPFSQSASGTTLSPSSILPQNVTRATVINALSTYSAGLSPATLPAGRTISTSPAYSVTVTGDDRSTDRPDPFSDPLAIELSWLPAKKL